MSIPIVLWCPESWCNGNIAGQQRKLSRRVAAGDVGSNPTDSDFDESYVGPRA